MAQIALIGYAGHGLVVTDILYSMKHSIIGYFEIKERSTNPYALPYLGNERDPNALDKFLDSGILFAIGLGHNADRKNAFDFLQRVNFKTITGIHSSAIISPTASVEEGTMVMPHAVVNPLAVIGKGCVINSGAVVEHECIIDDFAHIAPSATLAGNVRIGASTFIGANATVKQGLKIGKNVIVGAGSVVLNDIQDNQTWVGVPARRIL